MIFFSLLSNYVFFISILHKFGSSLKDVTKYSIFRPEVIWSNCNVTDFMKAPEKFFIGTFPKKNILASFFLTLKSVRPCRLLYDEIIFRVIISLCRARNSSHRKTQRKVFKNKMKKICSICWFTI